tara:strand:+ start:10947 stop:11579 length:633 start_codon:yes stop_codon:yes gene_type:complete
MAGIRLQDPMALEPFGAQVSLTGGDDLATAESNIFAGQALAWASTGLAAVQGFFSAQTKQQTLKRQANNLEFQGTQADQMARVAEDQALLLIESGNAEISRRGMRAGQEKAAAKVNAARRGVKLSAGSSAEVRASMEIVRQMDARTIRTNTRRGAAMARRKAVNARNQAAAYRVSAENARDQARAINPALVALGGAGNALVRSSTAIGGT